MIYLLLIFLFSFSSIGNAANQDSYPAPNPLPHVTSQMLSAGYWISHHPDPDRLLMSIDEIKNFNFHVREDLKLTKDIFYLVDHFQTEALMDVLKKNLSDFTDKGFYTAAGTRDDSSMMEKIKSNMHLSGLVLGIAPRYGIIVHLTDQRILPTTEGLYTQRGDFDFDELQNSALDVGTPVAIIHKSSDGKWFYVLSSLSDGWVKASDVAICDDKVAKIFAESKDFIVSIAPKADLFLDTTLVKNYDVLRMGASLPLLKEEEDYWTVQIPNKDGHGNLVLADAHIPKYQAHQGFLPYTARTIYTQAFLMLDKPYGWGDMNGGQDCSRFLQMVYATVGLQFPRDSKNQAQIGYELASFDEKIGDKTRREMLSRAQGAVTILPLKGHIMLFLGYDQDIPFVIHATSGYTKKIDERQIKYVVNRVAISDLSLGESGPKGSLLKRIIKIIEVR